MISVTDEEAFDPAELIRLGTVASVDLGAGMCVIDVGDIRTPPIRWIEVRAGATRTWSPPSVGEQVVLICPYGELAGALALRGINSDSAPPPGSTTEEVTLYADGARIAYDPEAHRLTATLPDGGEIAVTATRVTIMGDVDVTGTITATTDVIAAGKSLKNHRHTNVTAGGAQSGPPA